ncbi:MAG: tetratricopeptide repeat protein [Anaerolineae bacterium]|nr:tetratricopeptide repeat protein [Anaerolineae bacterium]
MARLEIALLGTFQVSKDGNPITRFETDPARALLAYLALHVGTPLRRETLADLLWPDQSRPEALHTLRQTLNRLRRAIGDREATPLFLHATRQMIQFDSDSDYWLDTHAFARLIAAIRAHAHRRLEACRACMQCLTEAADLYRGDLLPGFNLNSLPFQEWLTIERECLHRQAMEAFYHLADCHNRRGEYAQGQDYAQRQLELEPWREEAHRQLMESLALSGQRSAALAQYEVCCRTLSEELGVEPETETLSLYEQIRSGGLQIGGMPPHNLPAPLTRFLGRETELDRIADQLNDPDYRLLTLVGPGGVGKTRLALTAARRAVGYFPDGVWFVPLIGMREEPKEELHERLATAIGSAIGITFSGPDDPTTELLRILSPREALLILDSFEHLTAGVELVLEILKQAAKIAVLVTSRARLNVQAERLVQIAGLPVPPRDDSPEAGRYSSVQLFLDRAACTAGTLDRDLGQVASVCRLVEGVPLAIELASAWVERLPLAEIIANLQRDVDFLSATFQDIPERHRRLRAVFESSWQLLSAPEQRTLAQLAVFRGDFSQTAALAVAAARQAELVGLTHQSLLQRISPDRYTLHALVHQFAAEKLETIPPLASAYESHSTYYLAFVSERAGSLGGDTPQQAVAEIQAESANVRQAWQWAVAQVDMRGNPIPHITALGQCSEGLTQFYMQTGLLREGEHAFRAAAGRLRPAVQSDGTFSPELSAAALRALSKLLSAQGHLLACMGDHATAVTILQEADAAYEQAATVLPDSDPAGRATLLVNLGTSYNRVGERVQAVERLKAGLALARQADVPHVETTALSTLAQVACEQGAYDTAQQYSDEMLMLARSRGDRACEASALSMLGSIAWRWGDVEQASQCIWESLTICRELGHRHRLPRLLNVLGVISIVQEDYDQAERLWGEGLKMVQEMGDRQAMADTLNNLGYVNHHHLGNLEKAEQYYKESLAIARQIGHRQGATSTLSNLGHLHVLLGEHTRAWDYLHKALSESTAIGVIPLTLDALVGVARLQAAAGQRESAAALAELIVNHPAVEADSAQVAEAILTELREVLPAGQIDAALERGRGMELDAIVAELLDEKWTREATPVQSSSPGSSDSAGR